MRGEPVVNRDGHRMDAYLAEARSIGGLSGSPVFLDLYTAKTVKQPTGGFMAAADAYPSPSRFRLLGLVHGHFDWNDIEPSNDATTLDRSQSKLGINMGIAIIIPAEKIVETLIAFKDEEEKEAAKARGNRAIHVGPGGAAPRSNVSFQILSTGFELPSPKDKE
jgi:hypothetical protein